MWHVLLTEPNRERTAARHLAFLGCETYLPIFSRAYCQRSQGGRRWQVFRRPLFPGYLFSRAHEQLYNFARIAAGIRKSACPFLANEGKLAVIQPEKIREIQLLEREINQKRSERMRFRVGDRVLIRDGAFTGLRASVYQLTDAQRVTLLLDFLGRGTKVQLDVDQVDAMAA